MVESKIEQARRNVKVGVDYDLSWWIIIHLFFLIMFDSNSLNQDKRRLINLDWIVLYCSKLKQSKSMHHLALICCLQCDTIDGMIHRIRYRACGWNLVTGTHPQTLTNSLQLYGIQSAYIKKTKVFSYKISLFCLLFTLPAVAAAAVAVAKSKKIRNKFASTSPVMLISVNR